MNFRPKLSFMSHLCVGACHCASLSRKGPGWDVGHLCRFRVFLRQFGTSGHLTLECYFLE